MIRCRYLLVAALLSPTSVLAAGNVTLTDQANQYVGTSVNPLFVQMQAGGGGSVSQGTSPWVDNIAQFGGSAVQTGVGASGAGIPRVTISNDSFPSGSAYFQDAASLGVALTGFTGPSHDAGASPTSWCYYSAVVRSDQAGSATLQGSSDNVSFTPVASASITASTPANLSSRVVYRYWRVTFTPTVASTITNIASSLSVN